MSALVKVAPEDDYKTFCFRPAQDAGRQLRQLTTSATVPDVIYAVDV